MLWVIFNYLSQIEEIILGSKSYLKSSILWFIFSKGSILESHIFEEGQVFESYWKKKNRVQFSESIYKRVQFIETYSKKRVQFFESYWKKKRNNSLSHFEKNVQFFESHSRKRVQFLESNWKKVQFFESYFPKTINLFFESYIVSKRNILWVKLKKRHFLWVMLKRSVQFLIQLCESYWKRFKKIEFLEWIIFVKRD